MFTAPIVKKLLPPIALTVAWGAGILVGRWTAPVPAVLECSADSASAPLATINFVERTAQDLVLEAMGPLRLSWGTDQTSFREIEAPSTHRIPWFQIQTKDEILPSDINFVANTRTKKFHAINTYDARCVAPHERAGFTDQKSALEAGFVAGRTVK